MKEITGRIHSFQSLGTVDGPGIRCVVFMQGCPLRCIICHNPDTWDFSGGEEVTAEAMARKVLRYRNYFRNSGGITVSGGEPLMQAAFVRELFARLKAEGIHTCLDTSGCQISDDVKALLDVTDLVLLDHKYASPEAYLSNTGERQEDAEAFLQLLQEKEIPVWIRRVIIPGLNDDDASFRQLKRLRDTYSVIQKTELLPFRKICLSKYEALGLPFPAEKYPEPTTAEMENYRETLR